MTSSRTRYIAVVAAGVSLAAFAGRATARGASKTDNDARTIVHVLNRLGYGPTAAAIAHVKSVGVRTYIEEQLRPERVADPGMAARVSSFSTLSKNSRELAAEFFVPAARARREQQRRNATMAES